MPLLALAGPIAGALGASAATAATIGTVGTVAGGIYSAVNAADSQRKAIHGQQDAARASQIDINALNDQVKAIAKQNALDSSELERQLTPEIPQIRQSANRAILNGIGPTAGENAASGWLVNNLTGSVQTPLLQAAIARARADLGLGGQLDTDTQNAVTRNALATAGGVAGPGGGLGLGRDVTARDLGLTSLQLQQQRLQNATQLGGLEQQGAEFDAGNILNKIQLLKTISDGQFGRGLTAGQYGESIRQPIIGLDPSALANLSVGNSNARSAAFSNQADIYGNSANNWMKMLGQNVGGFLGDYTGRGASGTTSGPISYTDFLKKYPNSSAAGGS